VREMAAESADEDEANAMRKLGGEGS
jgi:hypothetical protein